jgi:hypothetical protein
LLGPLDATRWTMTNSRVLKTGVRRARRRTAPGRTVIKPQWTLSQ